MIVLVRLGVHEDGVVDARAGHAGEELLGRRDQGGLVGALRVVREALVEAAAEAVLVAVDHEGPASARRGRRRRLRRPTRDARRDHLRERGRGQGGPGPKDDPS